MYIGCYFRLCFCFATCLAGLFSTEQESTCFNQSRQIISVTHLPDEFKVSIEFADLIRNFSADLTEYFDRKLNRSSLEIDNNGLIYKFILNRTSNHLAFINKTEPEATCEVNTLSINTWPQGAFFFPSNQTKQNRPIVGLVDLFDLFSKSDTLTIDSSTRDHDHGLPVQHLIGCSKSADGKRWLEMKVCMTDKGFTYNNVEKYSVPTRIEVRMYENENTSNFSPYFNGVYEIFGYKTGLNGEDEAYQQPPGVYCPGLPKTKPAPGLPAHFSIQIEHVDHVLKTIDSDKLYYDSENAMLSMEFNRASDDEPGTMGTIDSMAPGHYRLVQDFRTGYQYVLELFTLRCVQAMGIPGQAGSIKQVSKAGKTLIGMKTPFELLFVLDPSEYTYVGQRRVDDQLLSIWQAYQEKRSKDVQQKELIQKITYELWASNDSWTSSGLKTSVSNLPVYFKTYKSDNYGRKHFTTQRFHNLIAYNESHLPEWPKLDVFSCFVNVSVDYFTVQLNDTLVNLEKIGLSLVTRRLRETLAKYASVSTLRVGGIHVYAEDNGHLANASFGIANKLKETGSKTEFYQPEIDSQAAVTKLNSSISPSDLTFDIASSGRSKTTVAIRKASLLRVVFFDGKNIVVSVKKGYSGGSVATLSFFMLFIGLVSGVLLSYVYLKRRRGGIAYQIYE